MTLTLPTYAEAHRADAVLRFAWLVAIGAVGSAPAIYLTDGKTDVVFGGHTYLAGRTVTLDGLTSAPEGNISIGNGDGAMSGRAALWRAEDANPTVTVTEVWFDATGAQQGSYVLAQGYLEAPSWDNQTFHARIVGSTVAASQPALSQTWTVGTCTYRAFKGPECGYSGASTTCERTVAACSARFNLANFGGINGTLPAAGDTVSMWGVTYTYRLRPTEV